MKSNMHDNFQILKERVLDTNRVSNLDVIKEHLGYITKGAICVGSGGSTVVSEMAAKVFATKNNCIAISKDPRDLLYEQLNNVNAMGIRDIFVCSYSGKNRGVEVVLNTDFRRRLFTNGGTEIPNVDVIRYDSSLPKEKSFISLGATLMPVSILMNYYLNVPSKEFDCLLEEIFGSVNEVGIKNNTVFEIMSGADTKGASKYLESTITEGGLGIAVVHDKYDFCHGRSTLAFQHKGHTLIYLQTSDTDLDAVLLEEAKGLYDQVIVLRSDYGDYVVDNFNLLVKAMYLTKSIAEVQSKDLSIVNYAPAVKRLYSFKGEM